MTDRANRQTIRIIHLDFLAHKSDDSPVTDEDIDAIMDGFIDVIESRGMLTGGGVHDAGDPDSETCEGCAERASRQPSSDAPTHS